MLRTVELPLWLLILILLFAAVTASTHLLFPSVRWFFRRRAERVVAKLNERLQHPIQPFKLLRRQDMIQRVIYDPDVVREVGNYAVEKGVREDVAFEKARDYAREIVPSFSAIAYFGFAIKAARWLAKFFFDVRLHHVDDKAISEIGSDATVVFVMNHRSNFDYVLVTYLAASRSALSYAVGEWAQVWPLSRLIRAMGAYFIRRSSSQGLYRRVLSTYVRRATEAGVTQAVFPEGGLSRDGRWGKTKLGILSYIVESWQQDGRDVVFVPVSLNYDRVVEDRILVAAGRSGKRRFRASIPEGFGFTIRYLRRRIFGKVGRFGVAAVTFGRPISLRRMSQRKTDDLVRDLAEKLAREIQAEIPIVTASLILAAMLRQGAPMTVGELSDAIRRLRCDIPDGPADFAVAADDLDALRAELDILVLRHLLELKGDRYQVADIDLAKFYANSLGGHLSALASKPSLPGSNAANP